MRLRNKPWAKDKIAENPQYVVPNPAEYKGNWKEVFGSENPLHIEVGTGKGQFLVGMAKQNPHINYIGIEMYESVILSALERLIEEELPNLKLLNVDANQLSEFFAKNDVDRVYLNFSDPWPKKRHAKRRLTYKTFLSMYENLLVDGGEIHFKTDNQELFEYSLTSFSEYGLLLKYISLDLHKSDFEGNVMTEYEEKFSQKGSRIYRCEVKYLNEKD
ncbi:tRNA (guanosine(46)-N7)-methyltransferase TrmB [Priestia megaterium]|uniref:tRNA (guanine-N(7)-)-methyltransferase n=1 Tax=Priestia megaterium (strain ATCC 14581 / DSM 32 / CCUG 1817 / JCM 2506 / NBRC 15308 / NCIMB 9376 / NCTC 10342 / NRRL B-14308 / VKM B-512 / Ford 19) TaxID=1348623 RepID=A0A0B6AAD4_PRIM2|nr:tRNA (guanosine(46)-N7)-methyltransferase TrmB [Priestia megaterium]AJI21905.1 tRNA (guanine-N(7)-)-methyltransferase [Priestia megaterium NBRC 15308 = ATCC 14581]KFN00439.1 tRNA (guanine-N(7)-)-methyltransferase [Priestia megaterium]KGJ86097.1 tRNA (guanine-N7)-methyltransferase [Priestia megaterium NBRC 15308 = ATCC 14581]MDH3184582.1 tRNA (guanosine(46)-N7)-methyltransferase TrmB [Priestia megaterium]MDR4230087.1 tRNA (guanosine(46)-N7)-methyltransferase TrmB [Priestia megaterium]